MEIIARGLLVAMIGDPGADFFVSEQYSKQLWLLLALGPALEASRGKRRASSGERPPGMNLSTCHRRPGRRAALGAEPAPRAPRRRFGPERRRAETHLGAIPTVWTFRSPSAKRTCRPRRRAAGRRRARPPRSRPGSCGPSRTRPTLCARRPGRSRPGSTSSARHEPAVQRGDGFAGKLEDPEPQPAAARAGGGEDGVEAARPSARPATPSSVVTARD